MWRKRLESKRMKYSSAGVYGRGWTQSTATKRTPNTLDLGVLGRLNESSTALDTVNYATTRHMFAARS